MLENLSFPSLLSVAVPSFFPCVAARCLVVLFIANAIGVWMLLNRSRDGHRICPHGSNYSHVC